MGEKEMEGVLYFKNASDLEWTLLTRINEMPELKFTEDDDRSLSVTTTASFTIQNCEEFAHAIDIYARPYIIYCNPNEEDKFGDEFKKKGFIIRSNPAVEEGMCYVADRRKLEKYLKPKFDFEE
jgi:hypothetical protein